MPNHPNRCAITLLAAACVVYHLAILDEWLMINLLLVAGGSLREAVSQLSSNNKETVKEKRMLLCEWGGNENPLDRG